MTLDTDVEARWFELGTGHWIGDPTGDTADHPTLPGARLTPFTGGWMLSSGHTAAWEMHPDTYAFWDKHRLDSTRSVQSEVDYGLPIGGESAVVNDESVQYFQWGAITRNHKTHAVRDGVRASDPVWGVADLHAHLMADLGLGGALWGDVNPRAGSVQPLNSPADAADYPGTPCNAIHGALGTSMDLDHPSTEGPNSWKGWPFHSTMFHQQAFYPWIYGAFRRGLRLVSCLMVNNRVLGHLYQKYVSPDWYRYDFPVSPAFEPAKQWLKFRQQIDDESSIDRQLAAIDQLLAYDAQHKNFIRLARTPDEARTIIADHKLALVLGLEVDQLGNCDPRSSLSLLVDPTPGAEETRARKELGAILDRYQSRGIAHILPIHLADNVFGGASVYHPVFELNHRVLNGKYKTLVPQSEMSEVLSAGIRYKLTSKDMAFYPFAIHLLNLLGILGTKDEAALGCPPNTLASIPADTTQHFKDVGPLTAHANARGLSGLGKILVQEMISRGMLIDVDHMGERTTQAVMTLCEQTKYPVVSSHTTFRRLQYVGRKNGQVTNTAFDHANTFSEYGTDSNAMIAHESSKSDEMVRRILALGGIIAPQIHQPEVDQRALPPCCVGLSPGYCPESSSTWGQAYLYALELMTEHGRPGRVAIGTDVNGLAMLPGQRFAAANGSHDAKDFDHKITDYTKSTKRTVAAQSNAVRYLGVANPKAGAHAALDPVRRGPDPASGTFDFNTQGMCHYGVFGDFIQDVRNVGVGWDQLQTLFHSANDFIDVWARCRKFMK